VSPAQAGSTVVTTALLGVGGAVLVAGAALFLGSRTRRPIGPALSLGLAPMLTFGLTRSWPALPPREALHWVFYLALAGAAAGVAEGLRGRRVWILRALVSVAAPVLLLEFQRRLHWERLEGILWTAGLAAALFATWSLLARQEERGPPDATRTLAWAFESALLAGTLPWVGGGLFAQIPLALAIATGLCALVGLKRGAAGLGAAGVAPLVVLHGAILWAGRFLYDLDTIGLALLTLAPLGVLVERLVPADRPWLRRSLVLLVPLLLAGVALGRAWFDAPPPSPYG